MRTHIREWIRHHENEILDLRRSLHAEPELSHAEFHTSARIRDFLSRYDVPVHEQVAGTGLLAELGTTAGKAFALRGDLDALQVTEETSLPFASRVPGVMHACGHDVHATIIAATNAVLSAFRSDLRGRVKFIYQPAEEADEGGAERIVREGHLDDVAAIIGIHVDPALEVGRIGLKDGAMMASIDFFAVTIKGPGGHGARPHQTTDTVFVASQVLNGIYQLTGRYLSPLESPAVISVGSIRAGHQANVIPESCTLSGTMRALDDASRQKLRSLLEGVISHTCQMYGAEYTIDIKINAPPVINDHGLGRRVRQTAEQTFGTDSVVTLEFPMMASEDFAYYRQKCPAYFLRLGVQSGPDTSYPLHNPKFCVDERVIAVGVELLANLALDYFEKEEPAS